MPPTPTMPVVHDRRHHEHDPAYELNGGRVLRPRREVAARAEAIEQALGATDFPRHEARSHGLEPLRAVHDPDLLAWLRDGYDAWRRAGGGEVLIPDTFRSPGWAAGGRPSASPLAAPGWWVFDTCTPLVAGSYLAARAAADVALTGADLLRAGAPAVYALTRPPGHHAGRDYLGGFCLVNHAAIAARSLQRDGGRMAVLDLDVHHGNGTQDIFYEDPQVHYVSIHGHPDHLFPFFSGWEDETGRGAATGTTTNLPLPAGADDDAVLAALDRAIDLIDAHDPEAVVVSLGLDAAADDPIGSLAVTTEGLATIGRRLGAMGRPLLLVQEGGYALGSLGAMVTTVLHNVAQAAAGAGAARC